MKEYQIMTDDSAKKKQANKYVIVEHPDKLGYTVYIKSSDGTYTTKAYEVRKV